MSHRSEREARALRGIRAMLRTNLALHAHSELLLIVDEHHIAEVVLFARACDRLRVRLTTIAIPIEIEERITRPAALPALVREAIKHCHGMVMLTSYAGPTTPFRMEVLKYFVNQHQAARAISMPGLNRDHFEYALMNAADIDRLNEKLAHVLVRSNHVVIDTRDGARRYRLTIPIDGRPIKCGSVVDPGDWDNIPTGETYVLPRSAGSSGRIAINGSVPGMVLTAPVLLTIAKGRIVGITSRDRAAARHVRGLFFAEYPRRSIARNALRLSEVGFGVNRSVDRLHGVPVVDEKMYGTVHLGFGRNDALGGRIKGVPHYDLVCVRPRVMLDGTTVLVDGRIRLPDRVAYLDWGDVVPMFTGAARVERSGHHAAVKGGELVFTVMHPVQKVEYPVGRSETGRLCATVYQEIEHSTRISTVVEKLRATVPEGRVLAAIEVLRRHRLLKVRP